MTEKIENLKINEISRNPYQPRTVFDEDKLDELATSIKVNGLLQPIIVRKSKIIGYELLSGERRFLASQKAGLTEIPSIIRNYTDQQMKLLSILENLQRENLNPLEEARSLENLAEKEKLTHEEISQFLGKSRAYVSNMIRLLKLPKELLYLLEKNELSTGHAKALLAESNPSKQFDFARLTVKKRLSVRELERLIKDSQKEKENKTEKEKDIYVVEIEEKLHKVFGRKINISSNSQYSGKITISFNNLSEFEKIIEKLEK